jgi:hypothetical protein
MGVALSDTLCQEGGGDTPACAAMAGVANGGDGEVDRFADCALAGGDGVETDVELLQDADELLWLELRGGVFREDVDHKAAPEVAL